MTVRFHRALLLGASILISTRCQEPRAQEQELPPLPQINVVRSASPIARRAPQPAPQAEPAPPSAEQLEGTLPIVTDQFATVTVVPRQDIQRSPGTTLGDLLFAKPGVTGSSFAPGASSRPIVRGLDVNRVGVVENGIGGGGVSDLGEDHFVPIDPLTTDRIEVIRGPATLRYGSQAIGGVVSATDNRIPETLPCPPASAKGCATLETRGAVASGDNGLEGGALFDAGGGNFAFHVDAFGRRADSYRIPRYPYLVPPDPATAPRATQPGAFNGRQPNSSLHADGQAAGASYVFTGGFVGLAVVDNHALYHIPGIDGEDHNTRIDAHQTKLLSKGEWRAPLSAVDTVRFWAGATDYKHNELGLANDADPTSDGIRQTFTSREQEGRLEVQFAPFDLRFAALTTAVGVQGGHQQLTAPSPDNAGLWDPNSNRRLAAYIFNEFKLSPQTKAQIAGRVEHVGLSGTARLFADPAAGGFIPMPASPSYTPKSISAGLIHDLPWGGLVGSITAQHVERAPKPAELFSGGGHDATATFDKGNPSLKIEAARSVEIGVRRPVGPVRFEATAYYTAFNGFIFRRLTGATCDDVGVCVGANDLREAIYSQRNAVFRGAELQGQWDAIPMGGGYFGIEGQYDIVRATFSDGSNVPRIPPQRLGGGFYFRNAEWLARINLLHAFAHRDIATENGVSTETPTAGYNLLKVEISRTERLKDHPLGFKQVTVGVVGNNLLNDDIRNSVSYTKDEVLMPGASLRVFANVKY